MDSCGFCASGGVKEFRRDQNYGRLRRECASKKILFQDDDFPADETSLRLKDSSRRYAVRWKRPSELNNNPRLVVGRLNTSNITQGSLGNCWFVAACCALARVERLWNKVVPDCHEQDWGPENAVGHFGIFHFRLWLFGRWTDVVIDDRLPTVDGQLLFAHSHVQNEFWCALLEKAYAKIFGSYAALESGNLVDALVDFTAGFAERLDLVADNIRHREVDRLELFGRLKQAANKQALMCCAIKALTPDEMERRTDRGLIKGHAYSITDVRSVKIARTGLFAIFQNRQQLNMVRLRNPWGEKEWNGPFSDSGDWCYSTDRLQRLYASSMEWAKVSAADRKKIGLTYQDDGEFWMTFEDFCNHFTDLSICNLVNTSWLSWRKTWHEYSYFGRWSDGPKLSRTDRSGGCSNHPNTFLRNPQYRLEIGNDNQRLLVMLQQEDVRGTTRSSMIARVKPLSIGFEILKVEVNRKYRLHTMKRITCRSDYGETRNVFHECRLDRGIYVLLPTTFAPRSKGNYLLRVFARENIHMSELKMELPRSMRCLCVSKEYCLAVIIRIKDGKDIRIPGSSDVPSCYFILTCGPRKIRGPTAKNTITPKWDTEVVFYLTESKPTAKIQVWNTRLLRDRLIGEALLELRESKPPKTMAWSVPLVPAIDGDAMAAATVSAGRIIVEALVTSNLAAV